MQTCADAYVRALGQNDNCALARGWHERDRNAPDRWWRDRDAAMLKLVDLLERWAAAEGEDVIVVFEREPSPPIRSTVIEVKHAPKPKANAADDEIVRLLKADEQPHAVRVVTSDRALVERAYAAGATVEGADSFRLRIESI